MGEVYRAIDSRLGRTVAIKFLTVRLSHDSDLRQRLEREARAVSLLNHPNICTLYDIGRHDDMDYLVMEYLKGQTLEQRLAKGALPLNEALRYGIEIAGALHAAHRQGIVHRDVKPGNIMLAKDVSKLLDFGLARLSAGSDAPGVPSVGPGESLRTPHGTVLGTVQYMAPEQLEGKEVDARTDIFALGAVLHEMVTGHKAFEGKSQASLIARIMSSDPSSISSLQPMAPRALDRLVRHCLEKDPEERWQSVLDVRKELQWIADSEGNEVPGHTAKPVAMDRRIWIVAALGNAAVLAGGAFLLRRDSVLPEPGALRFLIEPPPNGSLAKLSYGSLAVSPDGSRVVFGAVRDGKTQLYVRLLKSTEPVEAQPLIGSDEGRYPFWSPDLRMVAFFASGELRAVDITDGSMWVLCKVDELPFDNQGKGGTWNRDGDVVFATTRAEALYHVSKRGGPKRAVTRLGEHEESHRWPWFLPDGRRFLYLAGGGSGAVYAGSLDSDEKTLVVQDHDSSVVYVPEGYLLFSRNRTVMAQRFNIRSLKLEGESVRVTGPVAVNANINRALFSVSDNGTLVLYDNGADLRQVVRLTDTGVILGTLGEAQSYSSITVSRDGRRVAYSMLPTPEGLHPTKLGMLELETGDWDVGTHVPYTDSPVFSADGRFLFFSGRPSTGNEGAMKIYRTFVNDPDQNVPIVEDDAFHLYPTDASSDGRILVVAALPYGKAGAKYQVWRVKLSPDGKAQEIIRATEKPFNENGGRLSPDGRWLAYASDERGKPEVYVRELLSENGKTSVSGSDGGTFPVWRGNRQIVYMAPSFLLMFVNLTFSNAVIPTHSHSLRVPIDSANEPRTEVYFANGRGWDMSADGKIFYTLVSRSDPQISVVTNWMTVLPR